MPKKSGKPSWFKFWIHHKPILEAVPDEVAGRAIKAVLHYFDTGEVVPLGQLEMVVFAAMKPDVEESHFDYARDVENGRKGGRPKTATEEKPPVTVGNPPQPTATDGEKREKSDGEGDERERADKPPRSRFSPPSVDDVRAYCQEKGYRIDPEHFVDFYQSNGWRVGKNPMKDWKAAVRNWAKNEKGVKHDERNVAADAASIYGRIGTRL